MELFNKNDKVLEILNNTRNQKRISLEDISMKIGKDKSVTSRILNGKYNLDLETFINICQSLDLDPSIVLDKVINPDIKRIPVTEANTKAFDEILNMIKTYKQNDN